MGPVGLHRAGPGLLGLAAQVLRLDPALRRRGPYGNSILLGSLVLAIMVLPIVTSLSREVFMQTPKQNEEAALALGATKWR